MLGDGMVSFGVPTDNDTLQVVEMIAEDAAVERKLAFHLEAGGREIDVALVAVEVNGDVLLHLAHATDLVEKIHVPRRAAHLTVGDSLKAQVFLPLHRVGNGDVLVFAQIFGGQVPGFVFGARAGELRRAQETADVVGAEWRLRQRHGSRSFGVQLAFELMQHAVTRQHLRDARVRLALLADRGDELAILQLDAVERDIHRRDVDGVVLAVDELVVTRDVGAVSQM